MANKVLIRIGVDKAIETELSKFNIVFSNNKNDKGVKGVVKWFYNPKEMPIPLRINNSFWMINNWIDFGYENNFFTKDNTSVAIDLSQIDIDMKALKSFIKDIEGLYINSSNLLEISNLDFIRVPMRYWFHSNDEWKDGKDFIFIWVYSILKRYFPKVEIEQDLIEKFNNIEFKSAKKSIEKIWIEENYVNGGNEGFIAYESDKRDYLIKTISIKDKDIEDSLGEKEEYEGTSVEYAENEMIKFNEEISLSKINSSKDNISYKYENKLLPTTSFKTSQMINLLRRQKEAGIIITDIKIDNFAKIPLEEDYSKVIYSDFGKSFVKFREQEDYDRFFIGNIRDYYFFSKYYRSYKDYRNIIRDGRMITEEESFKKELKTFKEQVFSKRENIIYLCHQDIPKDIDSKAYEFRVCNSDSKATLFIDRKESTDLVYDFEKGSVCKCDKNKGKEIAEKMGLSRNKKQVKEFNNNFKEVVDSDRYE